MKQKTNDASTSFHEQREPGIILRGEYSGGEIAQCMRANKPDEEAQEIAKHFMSAYVWTSTAVCLSL